MRLSPCRSDRAAFRFVTGDEIACGTVYFADNSDYDKLRICASVDICNVPAQTIPMTAASLPRYLLRSDLADFYGLSRGGIDNYQRRAILPAPDGVCSTGLLWSQTTLEDARRDPNPTLAAVVPIDDETGRDDLMHSHAYVCPARSGHHIGWTSPSILGLVSQGVAQWYDVRACARYDGPAAFETSAAGDPQAQVALDAAAHHRLPADCQLTAYLLGPTPIAAGPIRVSAKAKTAGLQRGRLLRRSGMRVGAEGNWLDLSGQVNNLAQLDEFTLPVLDESFPVVG